MTMPFAAGALAILLVAGPAFAQDTPAGVGEPAEAPAAEPGMAEGEVGGAVGLATGAVGETFFIRAPAEYHLMTSEMPGRAVFLDTTATGMQRSATMDAPEAAGTVEAAVRAGEAPVGEITDVLIDRRGGSAALVVELNPEMRGGAREVAVAMGLVRMLPGQEDPRETLILLTLDPVDLESAPTYERPGSAEAGTQPQDVAPAAEAEQVPPGDQAGPADAPGGPEAEQPAADQAEGEAPAQSAQ